jgi:phosphate transport system substrate-binding protein
VEWLNAENAIAVATAVLGLAASVAVVWYERRVPRRKRIGFRVQLDTPIGSHARNSRRAAGVRLGLFNEFSDLSDATLVLLRVENDGSQSIAGDDYTSRERHGLTAVFTGRTIRGIAVTQPSEAAHLMEHFTPAAGLRHDGDILYLPKVPLNRGQHFKVLALLTGGGVGDEVEVTGGLRDGVVQRNQSTTVDDKPPLFSRPARLITVLFTVCVVTLAAIIVVRDDVPPPIGCATGTLTVTGSTAFAPAAEKLAESYERACPGSDVAVAPHGSTAGIRALAAAGTKAASSGGSPSVIAFSDGPKPNGYPELRENPVAVSVFTLVVNDRVTATELTLDEVRGIYRGEIRNWRDVDGPDLPVLLVSRDANSGTREVFQRRVLRRNEPANSSRDCRTKDDPGATVIRCELDSTTQVLSTVARLPGAIGYSEPRSAAATEGLHALRIDGKTASIENIGTSGYPYREIEYAYTYGRPPADSLAASFINYLTRGAGQDVVRDEGHFPCLSPEGLRLCGGR